MKYFFVSIAGDLSDLELCFLSRPPENSGLNYYKMAKGSAIGKEYPENAAIKMTDEYEGIKLATLIGHEESYLVLHRDAVLCIQEFCGELEIEYLPFTLVNHRNKPHSNNYFIVNPIGCFDCMDLDASEIEYYDDEIVDVDRFVLDASKLESAPALFRIPQAPSTYVINEQLAAAFKKNGFTNIFLTEIEQK